jgi:hypothetical protein
MSEHDDKGCSEEKCLRCGWVMGSRPLNCNNDNTPHSFPSTAEALRQAEQRGAREATSPTGISLWQMGHEQGQRDGYEQAKRVYMAAGEAGVALAASDALADALQRVEALPHSLECVTRDAIYSRPCNCLLVDALDAIKGDQP